MSSSQATENIREYLYDSPVPERRRRHRTLSRRKRQDILFGGGGILKDIFGVAYTSDVLGLNSRIQGAEERLNIQVKTVTPRRFRIGQRDDKQNWASIYDVQTPIGKGAKNTLTDTNSNDFADIVEGGRNKKILYCGRHMF